jgi:hypothetical protein
MAPRKTPTAESVLPLINALPPGEQVALWGMIITKPGWLGDKINTEARGYRLAVQNVYRDSVFPLEKELGRRQKKRPPDPKTLEYGKAIAGLKDDERLTWPRVVAALEREHKDWPALGKYRRARRTKEAYQRLLSWARGTLSRYRRYLGHNNT